MPKYSRPGQSWEKNEGSEALILVQKKIEEVPRSLVIKILPFTIIKKLEMNTKSTQQTKYQA